MDLSKIFLRWVYIVVAILPWVCIFGASLLWPVDTDKTIDLKGRPPPVTFAVVWTLICVLLTLVSLVAGEKYGRVRYLILAIVTVVCIFCTLWLFFDHASNASASCMSLAAVILSSLVLLIVLVLCKPEKDLFTLDQEKLQLVLATSMSLPITWGIYALLMNLASANLCTPTQ